MIVSVFSDYDALSEEAAKQVIDVIRVANGPLTLCFAAGDTPLGMFRALIKAYEKGQVSFRQCSFIGLDDWVGLTAEDYGSCRYTLDHAFFKFVDVHEDQLHFFNAAASDLEHELRKMNQWIDEKGGIDLIVLGIGRNAHLGFNEPGSSFDGLAHVVDLESGTQNVGQKYFEEEAHLSQGITIGLKQVIDARHVLVLANGEEKAEAVKKMVEGAITVHCPASILQEHPNCHVLIDGQAAKLLENAR